MDVPLRSVGWQICPVCKMWVKMTLVMLVHTSVCVCIAGKSNAVSKPTLMTQDSRLQCFSAHFQMVIRPFQSKLAECKETIICMVGHPSTCPGFFSQQPTLSEPFKNFKIFRERSWASEMKYLAGGLLFVSLFAWHFIRFRFVFSRRVY